MPRDEKFWNPYRWVPVSNDEVDRGPPAYHHHWQGLSGRLECTLEALTPFLIGSSKGDGRFIRNSKGQPFVPSTSLKGLVRSLAELIGNAAIPFPRGHADPRHALSQASQGEGANWRLDVAARMFGYLNQGSVFAGLVRFTDGQLVSKEPVALTFRIAVGQPRPERHRPFYPDEARRKFYHHHVGATVLVRAPANIAQTRTVYPLPPGVRFTFAADFENLRMDELALLRYCLVLQDNVSVTLDAAALGPGYDQPVTLTGPLRHKFGGCKPQGGGSVKITIDKIELRENIAQRYRCQSANAQPLEGTELEAELDKLTQQVASRTDSTMSHLRAMLIYCENDPRKQLEYPDFGWFQQDRGTGTHLKPTL